MKRISSFLVTLIFLFSIVISAPLQSTAANIENPESLTIKKRDPDFSLNLSSFTPSLDLVGQVAPVPQEISVNANVSGTTSSDIVLSEAYEIKALSSSIHSTVGGLSVLGDNVFCIKINQGDTECFSVTSPISNIKATFSATTSPRNIVSYRINKPVNNIAMYEITGLNVGYAETVIEIRNQYNQVIADAIIKVHVLPRQYPSLTLSSKNKTLEVGDTHIVNATFSTVYENTKIKATTYNSNVASIKFLENINNTYPLRIDAKGSGTARIVVYMETQGGECLAQAEIKITVTTPNPPTIDVDNDYVKISVDEQKKITYTIENFRSSDYLEWSGDDIVYCQPDKTITNNKFSILITGHTVGKRSFTMRVKDKDGFTVAAETVSLEVTPKESSAKLDITQTSISVAENGTNYFSINLSTLNKDTDYIILRPTSANIVDLSESSRVSDTVFVGVTGINEGSTTICAQLYQNDVLKETKYISVKVTDFFTDIDNVSHIFSNTGVNSISLELCQYMFGQNETAKAVFDSNIGAEGICYGMATTSALIVENTANVRVKDFDSTQNQLARLKRQSYNNRINLTLFQFIQAMHIAQSAPDINYTIGTTQVALTLIEQLNKGIPVLLNIYGTHPSFSDRAAGHAILACSYSYPDTRTMEVKVYDPNNPAGFSTLTFRGDYYGLYNSWSYPLTNSVIWGNTDPYGGINCLTYDGILELWQNRGNLANENLNLLSTTEDNFSVYNFDGKLVAKYQNGTLVQKADTVKEVRTAAGINFSKTSHLLYLPIDYYTICDNSPENGMSARLTNCDLSVYVETEADEFDLCAEDASNAVGTLFTPPKDSPYFISIGSNRSSDSDNLNVKGYGLGEPIGAEMLNGQLSLSGTESAGIGTTTDTPAYTISATSSPGGSVSTTLDKTQFSQGENCTCTISPYEGYVIDSVYVNGENVGAVDSYVFENLNQSHNIYVTFKMDLNYCDIELSETEFSYDGTEKIPEVVVTAPDGSILTENTDYFLSYSGNTNAGNATVFVTATPFSDYTGYTTGSYTISPVNKISTASYDSSENKVKFNLVNSDSGTLVACAYGNNNKLLSLRMKPAYASSGEVTIDFESDNLSDVRNFKILFFDAENKLSPLCKLYEFSEN